MAGAPSPVDADSCASCTSDGGAVGKYGLSRVLGS